MNQSKRESKRMRGSRLAMGGAIVAALSAAACVSSSPLEGLPCPCSSGWMCCPSANVCVEAGSACPGDDRPPGTAGVSGAAGAAGATSGAAGAAVSDGGEAAGQPGTDGGATDAIDGALGHAIPDTTYRLVQTRNLASPLPDPTGVASDGTGFWILSGGQNSLSNTLVHFNPDTGVTDRTFQFSGLIEMLGSGAYGITWDGAAVWISVAGNTNKLVRVDPTTGQIIRMMSSPTDLGPSDLDFDGTRLWLSSGTGTMYVIDPTTGGIERHYPVGLFDGRRDSGIAVRTGEVWVGELFGGMEIYDRTTGEPTAIAVHDDGSAFTQEEMGSMCFVGEDLVVASHFGLTYYRPRLTAP